MTEKNETSGQLRAPAPNPCDACPYRKDVPSGVWSHDEYDKLRLYDGETHEQQSIATFQCHVNDRDSAAARLCAGWCGCHGGEELLALRIAVATGHISAETYRAAVDYVSPVPLFDSGAEAADHGQAEIDYPSAEARIKIDKVARMRTDVEWG
ncbi:DUF6283 family protein [Streptomyces sp. NPDC059761]|uniref:DUF6283 family protein n=1 Tax=Streptomyces sp. NPDC059761 TaxID=3346937 RepID=UPI003660904C